MAYVGNTPFGPSCPSPTRVFAQVNTGFQSVRRSVGLAHDPTSQETPADMWFRLSRGQDKAAPGSLLGCRFVWPAQGCCRGVRVGTRRRGHADMRGLVTAGRGCSAGALLLV